MKEAMAIQLRKQQREEEERHERERRLKNLFVSLKAILRFKSIIRGKVNAIRKRVEGERIAEADLRKKYKTMSWVCMVILENQRGDVM